jgi:hypothetical protein
MKEPSRVRRFLRRTGGWALLAGLVFGFYLAYRWAEPSQNGAYSAVSSGSATNVTMRLENAPFTGYSQGHKTWALWAGRIDLERIPGGAMSNIQVATLTDIRDGKLYQRPASPSAAETSAPDDPVSATFHARQGRYTIGTVDPAPFELTTLYTIQWQFRLTGNVEFRTSNGDHFQTESLTVIEMTDRRTHRTERRIFCDSGVQVTLRDAHLIANRARYDPGERVVDCLGGVRGTFKEGRVQAERVFWALRENVLRCPETSTGGIRGQGFLAEGLTMDIRQRRLRANHVRLQMRMEEGDSASGTAPESRNAAEGQAMASKQAKYHRVAGAVAVAAAAGVLAGPGGAQRAQNPPAKPLPPAKVTPPPDPANKADKTRKPFTLEMDDYVYDEQTSIGTGRNFRYVQEDTVITGDTGRYNHKKELLDVEGNLILDDPKHRATGAKAHIDNGAKKVAVITGNVVITVKPEPETPPAANAPGGPTPGAPAPPGAPSGSAAASGATQPPAGAPATQKTDASDANRERGRGGVATCDYVEDYYRKKFVVLRGHLTFKQKFTKDDGKVVERTLTAEHAEYDVKTDKMVLFAPVEGHDTDGQTFHSPFDMTVGTKKGAEMLAGKKIHITGFVEEQEEETESQTPSPPAAPANPKKQEGQGSAP